MQHLSTRLRGAWRRCTDERSWQLREAGQRLRTAAPDAGALLLQQQELARRLHGAARKLLTAAAERVQGAQAHLLHLNPERVLDRGYSITETADGAIIRDSAQLTGEQALKITLARGWAEVRVKRTG